MPRKGRTATCPGLKKPEIPSAPVKADSRQVYTAKSATAKEVVKASTSSGASNKPLDANNNHASLEGHVRAGLGKGKQSATVSTKQDSSDNIKRNHRKEKSVNKSQSEPEERFRSRYGLEFTKKAHALLKQAKPKICDMIPELNEAEETHPACSVKKKTEGACGSSTQSFKSSAMDFSVTKSRNRQPRLDRTKPKGRCVLDMSLSFAESGTDGGSSVSATSHDNRASDDVERMFSRPLPIPAELSFADEHFSSPSAGRLVFEEYYAFGQARGLARMWTGLGPQDKVDEDAEFEQW